MLLIGLIFEIHQLDIKTHFKVAKHHLCGQLSCSWSNVQSLRMKEKCLWTEWLAAQRMKWAHWF